MKVKVKKLHPEAEIPCYATLGSACFDIQCIDGGTIDPGASRIFNTGLAFEIPGDHVMLVYSRSGHGFKNNTRLANCTGVIDSDYRGEVKVKLTNDGNGSKFTVPAGARIAQAMIIPIPSVELVESDKLNETERSGNGFGSTGG